MNPSIFHAVCCSAAIVALQVCAGEVAPPPLVAPNPPPVPPPVRVQVSPPVQNGATPPKITAAPGGAELLALLMDMQNGDAAKRDAAVIALVTKGASAYRSMNQFMASPDKDLAARAKDVRSQIEKRGMQMCHDAEALMGKAMAGPLNAAALEDVRKAWIAAATYAPQPELRQNVTQAIQSVQMLMGQLEQANKEIATRDAELAATPAPTGVSRAAIQLARSQAFSTVNRFDEALKASQDAFDTGGRECRLASAALKSQAELMAGKGDFDGLEKVCKKLIAEYGESLEARYAYGALPDVLMERKRWDEAVDAVKKFIAACPLEDEPQESANKLIEALMEKQRDYPRAYGFSTWVKQRMPASRVTPETVKVLAWCSEYAVHDYAKAEIAYKSLATDYADVVTASEVAAALARVKAKVAGTFPKEPKAGDEGPAGALGNFLTAVRARDAKKLGETVPAAEAIEAAGKLTCEECDLIHSVTFGDFVVKKTNVDGEKAEIVIDYYDAASNTPHTITQKAIVEKGAWKIQWSDLDDQLNPVPAGNAPKVPKPVK